MPELPEVETVRRGLEPALVGRRFLRVEARRPDLRFPLPERFVQRPESEEILSLGRRAKYLVAPLSSGEALVMHLGMTGRFTVADGGEPAQLGEFVHATGGRDVHDHVVFQLSGGTVVTYNDVRRFGFMDLVPTAYLFESTHFRAMGIEPLGNELSGETIARLFANRSTPLKAALLDQRLIAGLGNIYVCEALFRAGLDPRAPAGSLVPNGVSTAKASLLAQTIRDVLLEAVEAGGSTLRDYAQTDGSLGYFQHAFRVYGREGEACTACGEPILRMVQSGRSTFYCAQCQAPASSKAP